MKSRMLLLVAAPLLGILVAGTVFAAVPFSTQRSLSFYSMQLRGVSFAPGGQNVEIFVYDQTFDGAAFGSITITDLSTSTVLFSNTYGSYGDFNNPGTFAETVTLPYDTPLQIDMAGQEFSNMRILFGDEVVASGGTANGIFPSFSRTVVLVPEPTVQLSLLAGLGALGILGQRRRRSRS